MVTKTKTSMLPFPTITETVPPGTLQFQPFSIVLSQSRTGNAQPKWRKLVAANVSATTTMTATGQYFSGQYIEANMVRITPDGASATPPETGFVTLYRTIRGGVPAPQWDSLVEISSTKADNVARARLFAALRQQKAHTQGLVSVGELPQTIREIGKLTGEIANLFAAHRRLALKSVVKWIGAYRIDRQGNPVFVPKSPFDKRPKVPKGVTQSLADHWLQFSFGVRPLIKDVKDLAESVARWNIEREFGKYHAPLKIRGYGLDTSNISVSPTSVASAGTITYWSTTKRWTTVEVIYRASLKPGYITPAVGSAYRLFQLLGSYDLENWVPSAWNLLPWSFLVDYVTNVADVCSAMLTDTSSVAWVNKTIRWETHQEHTGRVIPSETAIGPRGPVTITQGGAPAYYDTITRKVIREQSDMSVPSVTFELPTGGFQLANILALMSGNSPRSFR